jgi:hypothetical protein
MKIFFGNLPIVWRFYPDRGWYRRQDFNIPGVSIQPYGPYPTRKEANLAGDPPVVQQISYHLIMPAGCHDIRKPAEFKW